MTPLDEDLGLRERLAVSDSPGSYSLGLLPSAVTPSEVLGCRTM